MEEHIETKPNDETKEETGSCCSTENKPMKEPKGFWSGLMYGLIPHTGCIAFIVFAILGVSTATAFFKPLLMSPHFFYILLALSFVFATISAAIYLKKHNHFSMEGIKAKWKYLTVLYSTSIGVNLVLFILVFPLAANMTGAAVAVTEGSGSLSISVDIPCPGHSPLITGELQTIKGVESVVFSFPNDFDIAYDSSKTSKEEILSLSVFNTYPAEVLSEEAPGYEEPLGTCGSTGGCGGGSSKSSGGCGGSCGCSG